MALISAIFGKSSIEKVHDETLNTVTSQDDRTSIVIKEEEGAGGKADGKDNRQDDKQYNQQDSLTISTLLCIICVFLVMFLSALDQTIVVTIIAELQIHFQSNNTGWIISGYMLPVCVLSLIWGRVGYIFGTKKITIISVIIFEIGSLISGLSHSMNMLIIGRVIAGIGGSGITTLIYLIINELSTIKYRSLFMNIVSVAFGVSSVAGPLMGGAFSNNSKLTWRWCFYINLPIGGFALAVFILTYHPKNEVTLFKKHQEQQEECSNGLSSSSSIESPSLSPVTATENLKNSEKLKIICNSLDWIGFILITSGLTITLLAISFGNDELFDWDSASTIVMFIIGGILLILSLIYEFYFFPKYYQGQIQSDDNSNKYDYNPLIPISIFKFLNYQVIKSSLFLFTSEFIFIVSCIYLSIFLQYLYDLSELLTGIYLLPMIISVTISSTVTSILISKFKFMKLYTILSGCLSMLSSGLLSIYRKDSNRGIVLGLQIFQGLAFGISLQPGMLTGQVAIEPTMDKYFETMNIITSFLSFIRGLGSCLGSMIGSLVFKTVISNRVNLFLQRGDLNRLEGHLRDARVPYSMILDLVKFQMADGVDLSHVNDQGGENVRELKYLIDAVTFGYRWCMYLCIILGFIEFCTAFTFSRRGIPRD
ncbi:hypothetical protein BVG19_g412 [[Candida] boidinii]|nr:hypothetical protein BVG19_g412 [[Candida] boidinii]OWB50205.1 hypothetical protein B5S27_g1753 [[Candida] boidinii]